MMIRRQLASWLFGLAAVAMAGSFLHARDTEYSVLLDRFEAPEAELAQRRVACVAYGLSVDGDQNYADGGFFGEGKRGGCQRGAYAGYDLTILRPYVSDVNFGPGWGNQNGFGHRFVLGAEVGSGLAARLRYWMFNHGHDGVSGLASTTLNIDMDVADLEATLRERMRNWDLLLSGGVRYGRVAFNSSQLFPPSDAFLEGVGPTVSIETTRDVVGGGLYLIGNLRVSMLFGEVDLFGFVADDEITAVLDNQLGLGWSCNMGRAELHLRGVWESQFWLNDTLADDFNGLGTNLGFSGPSVAVEVRL